jgi:hypothetical protein
MGAAIKRDSAWFHDVVSFRADRRSDQESRLADSAQPNCWIPDRPHALSAGRTRERLAQ